jgi:osmotically inducible lipoprotein OsmB
LPPPEFYFNSMIHKKNPSWHGLCIATRQERYSQKGERMKKLTAAASLIVMTLGLGACASNPTNAQIGATTGAVVGGVVGSALTGGSAAGTVVGAGAGAAAGYEIGKRVK